MGSLFGHSSRATKKIAPATHLRVQTVVQGRPRAIGAGQNRLAGNMVWYGGFAAHAVKTPGGKGGSGGATTGKGGSKNYEYSASFLLSVAEGPIDTISAVFNGSAVDFLTTPPSETISFLQSIGVVPTYGNTWGVTILTGRYDQTGWGYLNSLVPTEALMYRGEAVVGFANYNLGSSTSVPSFGFEVIWELNGSPGTPTPDVNPADWIEKLLTNEDWGVYGFPSHLLASLDSYRTYCQSYGLFISPLIADQTSAEAHLSDLMIATASDILWADGKLNILPMVDLGAEGNGAVFSAQMTPVYHLSDFLPYDGADETSGTTIVVSRKDVSETKTTLTIEYLDRSSLYNPVSVTFRDDANRSFSGIDNPGDKLTQHFFCLHSAAAASAPLQLARSRLSTEYRFTLPPQFILLNPGDIVTLTEPRLGLDRDPVRIIDIEERSDLSLNFTCQEIFQSMGKSEFSIQPPSGRGYNANEPPGSLRTPLIFEAPRTLAQNEIWIVASGTSVSWGGAFIWISLDDGVTYNQVSGQISSPGKQGITTTVFPGIPRNIDGLTYDTANTLSIDMGSTHGAIESRSPAEMAALIPLCYVGGEFISYSTSTLTSTDHYNLLPTIRGVYGTPIVSHSAGSEFALLDDSVYKYKFNAGLIGHTVKFKLQSFNRYGGGVVELSDVPEFTYTVVGSSDLRTDHYSGVSVGTDGVTIEFIPDGASSPTPFTFGPNGSSLPYVNVTWDTVSGDSLVISSLTRSSVSMHILNSGNPVARTANVIVTGY